MATASQALPSWNDKAHLRYHTHVVALLRAAAISVNRRRRCRFRLGVTGDNGVELDEEIH